MCKHQNQINQQQNNGNNNNNTNNNGTRAASSPKLTTFDQSHFFRGAHTYHKSFRFQYHWFFLFVLFTSLHYTKPLKPPRHTPETARGPSLSLSPTTSRKSPTFQTTSWTSTNNNKYSVNSETSFPSIVTLARDSRDPQVGQFERTSRSPLYHANRAKHLSFT